MPLSALYSSWLRLESASLSTRFAMTRGDLRWSLACSSPGYVTVGVLRNGGFASRTEPGLVWASRRLPGAVSCDTAVTQGDLVGEA